MVFAMNGAVRWKGKSLANGIDGKYETNNQRTISRLQTLGFRELAEVEAERKMLAEQQKKSVATEKKETKSNEPSIMLDVKTDEPQKNFLTKRNKK